MKPDDKVCYCFHVSLRKLVNYARRERPARPSGMGGCLGAGTGCGWCVPFLERIWEDPDSIRIEESPEEYARRRTAYHRDLADGKPRREH